jgi:hypothetical protein
MECHRAEQGSVNPLSSARALPSACALNSTSRAPCRFLQPNGFPKEPAAEVFEIEPIIDVRDGRAKFDADVLVQDPRDVPVDGCSIEQRQDYPLFDIGHGSVVNADFCAHFGKIDNVANHVRVAESHSGVLTGSVAKLAAPVSSTQTNRCYDVPMQRALPQFARSRLFHHGWSYEDSASTMEAK